MATVRLTAQAIEGVRYDPAGPSRQVLWDQKLRGLGVRVTPAQSRFYVLSYRTNGRSRLMALGRVEDFRNVEEARDAANECLRNLRRHRADPIAERRKLKASGTVKELLTDWLAAIEPRRRPSTLRGYRHHLSRYLLKEFGGRIPQDVTRPDVRRLHARISQTAPYQANRVVATLRAAYTWASKQDNDTLPPNFANPARGIEFNREKARDEMLRPVELPRIAAALDQEPDPWARAYLWLLLLIGCRKSELLRLRWEDVNLELGEIVLRDTKNGSDFRTHLSAAARDVLRDVPRIMDNPYVFPNRRRDATVEHMGAPRTAWVKALAAAGIDRVVTLHDLRRSAGTLLARAGFTAEQIGRQLNHRSAVTAKHYVRIADDLQQRMADELGRVVAPGRVPDVSNPGARIEAARSNAPPRAAGAGGDAGAG